MLPPYLTDEELFALYLCVFDSFDSSSDENEDDDDDDDESIQRTITKALVDSKKKHDWQPESWAEDPSELHARIAKWIAEVAAQQERGSRKRAATDDTATLSGINHPPVAKRRRETGTVQSR